MPAVSADTLTLPRIAAPTLGDTERPVRSVTTGPRGSLISMGCDCAPASGRQQAARTKEAKQYFMRDECRLCHATCLGRPSWQLRVPGASIRNCRLTEAGPIAPSSDVDE